MSDEETDEGIWFRLIPQDKLRSMVLMVFTGNPAHPILHGVPQRVGKPMTQALSENIGEIFFADKANVRRNEIGI